MSLAVAIHLDEERYGIAADSRVAGSLAGQRMQHGKLIHRGPWFGGWVGDVATAQTFLRALQADVDAWSALRAPEDLLVAAWRATVETCGIRNGECETKHLDLGVLFVGPAGIVHLCPYGAVLWEPGRYAAIGCADAYAAGYLDATHPHTMEEIGDNLRGVMPSAADRFPGIGPPFEFAFSASTR